MYVLGEECGVGVGEGLEGGVEGVGECGSVEWGRNFLLLELTHVMLCVLCVLCVWRVCCGYGVCVVCMTCV